MSGSYRQCSECGKRALSIATRCPGCGRELPPMPAPQGSRMIEAGRRLPVPAVAGLFAAAAVLAAALPGRGGRVPATVEPAAEEPAAVESSSVAGATTPAAAPAADTGELLVARTWTHVRSRRSVGGTLEAVLLPGDTVLADSLSGGWYRVALEGEVLGYAHRSTLAGGR
jgi:hypothetical protein